MQKSEIVRLDKNANSTICCSQSIKDANIQGHRKVKSKWIGKDKLKDTK